MKDDIPNSKRISIYDLFAAQRKERRRQARKDFVREHLFDICNLILAVLALVISILGLFLP